MDACSFLATIGATVARVLMANLVPFTVLEAGEKVTLWVHLAKATDQVNYLCEGGKVLVIFQGQKPA